jgi:hypothetical protein
MEAEARALATRAGINRQQAAEAKETSRKIREQIQLLKRRKPGIRRAPIAVAARTRVTVRRLGRRACREQKTLDDFLFRCVVSEAVSARSKSGSK